MIRPIILLFALFGLSACRTEEPCGKDDTAACPECEECEECEECPEDTGDPDTEDCDDEDMGTWYLDADGDGYGVDASVVEGCRPGEDWIDQGGDCDDTDAAFNPGADEPDCADPNDYNCDGSVMYEDLDGDGFAACEECDDADATNYPGAPELCDGIDNDCDHSVDEEALDAPTWYTDADGDGYGDEASTLEACDQPSGYTDLAGDCDDAEAAANPGTDELCDGIDNDCDGDVDESDAADVSTWYADTDGDGWGDDSTGVESCSSPAGFTATAGDCDDGDASISPDATETCNGVDDDCDGSTDGTDAADVGIWYTDADGDGYGDLSSATIACTAPSGTVSDASDCDDGDATVSPAGSEVCNSTDDDCDGVVDDGASDASTWYYDADGDGEGGSDLTADACTQPSGYVTSSSDCDDLDASSHSGGTELCDGADNDCDGTADNGALDATTWYADADGDGYGSTSTVDTCDMPSGYAATGSDCDDGDAAINPAASESCDGVDNDCDGSTDESDAVDADTWYADADGDGYGDESTTSLSCSEPSGYTATGGDCDDTDATINPDAEELCDSVDWDCDGLTEDYEGDDSYVWYADADGDGYGDADGMIEACTQPSGHVVSGSDCDDTDATIHPTAADIPGDGVDQNCDGSDECGDLNCDGYPDLVFAQARDSSSYEIDSAVYWGSAAGYSDSDRTDLPTNGANAALVEDIDEDGWKDILFVGYRDDSTYQSDSIIYWGSSTGFSASDATDLSSWGPINGCIGDLDLDGYKDIVLPGYYDGNYGTYTYIYWGSATGYSSSDSSEWVDYGVRYCEIEDLDQDGWPDLVTSTYYDTNDYTNSHVYWGSSTRMDGTSYTSLPNYRSFGLLLTDVDEDGWTDILLPTYYDGNYSTSSRIYHGSSAGYSTSDLTTLTTYGARDVAVADFDQDGRNDILWAQYYSGSSYYVSSYVYFGTALGYNTSTRSSLPAYGVGDVEVVDFDGDGWEDIYLSSYRDGSSSWETTSYVYYNDDGGGFVASDTDALVTYGSHNSAVADLNADGYPDIVASNYYDGATYAVDSFIFWGSASGFDDGDRTDLGTTGAWRVTIVGAETAE